MVKEMALHLNIAAYHTSTANLRRHLFEDWIALATSWDITKRNPITIPYGGTD